MGIKKYIECVGILLKTSTVPKGDWFYVAISVLLTIIRYPRSVFSITRSKKHFLSDFLPHPITIKTADGIFFIARPKFEDLARFLFSKTVAKWEPLSIMEAEESDIIVDVGANVGYYTLRLSPLVGKNGKVLAIEAEPESCEILKKNCELNKLSNVEVQNFAITDKKGTVTLYTSGTHSGANSIFSDSEKLTRDSLTVPSTTLDDLLDDKYPVINWMKIDVEGAELKVLRGSSNTLKHTKKIIVELHEHILKQNNENPEAVVELLRNSGFKIKLFEEYWNPSTSSNKSLKSDYILAER